MKIVLDSDHPCHSSARITQALARYAPPGVVPLYSELAGYAGRLTNAEKEADVILMHVGGRWTQTRNRIERYKAAGKRFAILQLALRGTQHPKVSDWMPFWRDAVLVWSYYDLVAEADQDGVDLNGGVNFYHSSLGADPDVFFERRGARERKWTVLVEGDSVERDSLGEIHRAIRRMGGRMVHLGPKLIDSRRVETMTNISDAELASVYRKTDWIAALRTIEGFELCAAEGLLCGVRPILFDRPHHRKWFGGLAEYMPEEHSALLTEWLLELFKEGPKPVSAQEHREARERFDWKRIADGFWERLLDA